MLSYVPFGGALAESKNKELEEKVKAITDLMKELAGAMCSLPLIKVKSKDMNTCFSGVTVPPEYLGVGILVMSGSTAVHMEAGFKHRHREGGYIWFLAMPLSCSSKRIRVQVCRIVIAHFV